MGTEEIIVTLVASIVSGIVATIATLCWKIIMIERIKRYKYLKCY